MMLQQCFLYHNAKKEPLHILLKKEKIISHHVFGAFCV